MCAHTHRYTMTCRAPETSPWKILSTWFSMSNRRNNSYSGRFSTCQHHPIQHLNHIKLAFIHSMHLKKLVLECFLILGNLFCNRLREKGKKEIRICVISLEHFSSLLEAVLQVQIPRVWSSFPLSPMIRQPHHPGHISQGCQWHLFLSLHQRWHSSALQHQPH